MLKFALAYAKLGWPVFPLQPRSKIPLAGSHGHKDATTDEAQIKRWWTENPDYNIGVAPDGVNLFGLDVDVTKGGEDSLDTLTTKWGKLPDTPTTITGSGGNHIWTRPPKGTTLPRKIGILPGLDALGAGGYAVMPPSIHPNGRSYEWEASSTPKIPLAETPKWLVELVSGTQAGTQPPTSGTHRVEFPARQLPQGQITEGRRHETLVKLLGAMRRVGSTEIELQAAAEALNTRFRPPLSAPSLAKQVESILKYAPEDVPKDLQPAPTEENRRLWYPKGLSEVFGTKIPPVQWLIPGVLSKGSVGYIGSPPKLGKSWLSLHILTCLASGKPFLGLPEFLGGCHKGLYISEEDPERMVYSRTKRLWDGLNPSVTPDGQMKVVVKSGFRLDDDGWLATLEETILAEKLVIVIMDVFNRLHSKDGNKAEEVIPILAALDGIRTRTGCTILIDTHFKKGLGDDVGSQGQRISGSVGLHGWSECSIYLDWPKGQPGQAILNFESKEFAPRDPLIFAINPGEGFDEDDDTCPLVLSATPLRDGTKKGAKNRQHALVSLGLAWEKAGTPPSGVPLADVMALLDPSFHMTENTLRSHLLKGGAVAQKVQVGNAHPWMFRPQANANASS